MLLQLIFPILGIRPFLSASVETALKCCIEYVHAGVVVCSHKKWGKYFTQDAYKFNAKTQIDVYDATNDSSASFGGEGQVQGQTF